MEIITEFIKELIIYDYILFGSSFVIFLLFIILGIIFRNRVVIAIFFIFFAFIAPAVASTYGYIKMHEYLFKNKITITSQKKLTFTKAVVVYATLTNESNRDFQSCKITAIAHKVSGNEIKDYILKFKPINKMSIIENDIQKGQERAVKFIIEPFTYEHDYNVTVKAACK